MAGNPFSFIKDIIAIKTPKKSTLVLRMIVFVFTMVCGVYICSICLKQISTHGRAGFLDVPVIQKPCPEPQIEPWEIPYVHYPIPKTYSRAECACNPVRYFVILSIQRSGSGWFETLLNNHTNISSNGEIFSVKVRRSNISTIVETLDKIYNLDWLSSASKNECTAAVGLKWMLNQAEILANYKPMINATLLIPNLKQVEETTAKALEYFKSTQHIIVYYEDVVKNNTKLIDIQDFLKVPRRQLTSRQVKIHKGSISSQITNWDDVQKTLKGTHYESFLHADYRK
ncbi:uncharacterized protein LOC109006954 isoform X4 [Juglans regia]|uniref:Uncharacterized protein LOC109006954 isoform X4 n=1 Tax=Juglans regia TaxID=51240 RepID=A0A6P9EHK9_JUGRE|nr:uncharacterized protein LOC109006954 isoform X4 [Juglans regia]